MNVIKTGTVKKGSEFVEMPVVWEEFVFFTPEGLNKWHKERSIMKNQPKTLPDGVEGPVYNQGLEKSKTKRTLVSDDPDKIAKLMFGPKVKGKDLLSWDGCWKAAHEAEWAKDPEQWRIFMDSMREKIVSRLDDGLEFPDEMLDELDIEKPNGELALEASDVGDMDTPRQALVKIHQLTGSKLRKFLQDFIDGVSDSSLLVKTTPKVDGQAYRIAWLDGKVMMELSHTGLMDKQDVATNHNLRAHEKNFYEYNEKHNAKKVQSFISSLGLDGIKVIGELLPNGEGLVDDNGTITYVGTSYDASKLGKEGTMVMFSVVGLTKKGVSDLDDVNETEIMDFLSSEASGKDVQFLDIDKFAQ